MGEYSSMILIFLLILLNASFVASEFALARLRKTQIDNIAEGLDLSYSKLQIKTAKLLQQILLKINDYISACQVGITIVSLSLGAVAEAKFAKIFTPYFLSFDIKWLDPHIAATLLAIAMITILHVILGEVVPKNLAIISPEKVAFAFTYYLRFLYLIFKIPVIILNGSSSLILRLIGIDTNFSDDKHTEAEIKMILSSSQAQGVLEAEEEQLMQNVFEFNDTIARDIMVPRSDIFCISADMSIEEAGIAASRTSFSRFPVFQDRIDNMIGYFNIKDVLKAYRDDTIHNNIKAIISQPLKVSDGIYVIDLLKIMQERKKQIAVLIDEFGGVSGLITAEDIVEEIFGEIDDEDDKKKTKAIEKLNNGDVLLDGLTNLQDLNEELGESSFRKI